MSYDPVLHGHDPTPGIVALHLDRQAGNTSRMRLYVRDPISNSIRVESADFYPFMFLQDIKDLDGFPRERFKSARLEGTNPYGYVAAFSDWSDHWDAVRHVRDRDRDRKSDSDLYLISSPEQQYLMQTGRTLFKGLTFDELHRLQIDIETYAEGEFSNPRNPEDRIIVIALSDNRDWHELIDGRELAEAHMLEHLVSTLQSRDPDVIEGHNIFGFDLPYILARCDLHRIPFTVGRNGAVPRRFSTSIRFAERLVDFEAIDIAGRHVIDTYFQAMSYDVFKRDLPGYGLKTVAKYFGFADPGRTYVEGPEISRLWDDDPDRLLDYALDDVRETQRIARHLSGSTFYLTQMLPMSYQQAARTGPAAKIESLFVREYLKQRHALPKAEWGAQESGGYTDIFVTGVVGPVIYADVESLYPSIMINYDVRPSTDGLDLFQQFLRRLTTLRLETKRKIVSAASEEERSELDARQNSYKILINSFYGQLGFSNAIFNDFSEADRVAETGQQILRKMIAEIHKKGGKVIEVDTDGVFFIPSPDVRGEKAERAFVESLNEAMPKGIRIGFDGRYERMLSYKKKNYALLGYDGRLKFKGSSLISRSAERFTRRFVREACVLLLGENVEKLHELYLAYRERILTRAWRIEDFARTETLKESTDQYEAAVATGRRPRSAAYELAIRQQKENGRVVRKGDRISYYVAGTNRTSAFLGARLAAEWNPDDPDENTAYYLRRLDEVASKFEPFFSDTDFRLVFSPEDLFGFSSENIKLKRTELKRTGLN